jgi:pyridoxine 4-dehydrogenase
MYLGLFVKSTHTDSIDVNRKLLKKTQELLGDVPIDVYLPARILPGQDPVVYFAPFEALRKEGLFGALGASEVSATTLKRLSEAYIIAVAEIEVSLWSWEKEIQDVVAWSTATKTPVYAYSPLGRGFITRTFKTPEDIPAGSIQSHSPRFQGEAFYHNLELVDKLDEIAAKSGLTTAQLAIAWVCATGPYVSSFKLARADQNTADSLGHPHPWLIQRQPRAPERRGRKHQALGRRHKGHCRHSRQL